MFNKSLVLKLLVVLALIVAPLMYSTSVRIDTSSSNYITLNTAEALTSADFTYTNPNANTAFLLAHNALPGTGGTLQVLSSGSIDFAAAITITKPNVVIIGSGIGTAFTLDGINPPFIAGANGLSFINCTFDVSPNMGATTNWQMTNVKIGAVTYTSRNPNYSVIGGAITGSSVTDTGLTAGQVTYAGASGLLTTEAGFTYNAGTDTLSAVQFSGGGTGITGVSGTVSGLTAGRVPYASGATTLTNEAGFEYNAGTDTLSADHFSGDGSGLTGISTGTYLVSGALTAGNTNAYAFNWQNPNAFAIIILELMVDVTTAGGTASSVIDCGSAANTGAPGDDLINGAAIDTIGTSLSTARINVAANGGVVDWITGQILVANSAGLVGKYYIRYIAQ